MNLSWSKKILEILCEQGVEEFVFCAGARNSPLVLTIDQARGLKAYSFFEERSASFFALGLSRASGRPVAIITTSGTAVAELLPATIEAFHTGVPLVLVTADRPKRLRGTGAPQAIVQTQMFSKFIDDEFDLELGALPAFKTWTRRAPIHINMCFDEPLVDGPLENFDVKSRPVTRAKVPAAPESAGAAALLGSFIGDSRAGDLMVLVGTLDSVDERKSVTEFLVKLRAPVYLEATSGLREVRELEKFALRSGDKILPLALKRFGIKRVLRLGGVPTARVWRDLEDPKVDVQTFSLSSLPFAGLSRGTFFHVDLATELSLTSVAFSGEATNQRLLDFDRSACENLETLIREEPFAEPSLVRALSEKISAAALVYIGNSLPIREWDLAATYADGARAVEANRGVNGIEGQVSSFLGLAKELGDNWCIIGDLTAMYDLAGPWACGQKKTGSVHVVVINNGGGKIFKRIFNNELFENRHDFDFMNWAAQWRWNYEKWTTIPKSPSLATKPTVIELVPDESATQRFWDRYDAFFI